MYIVLAFFFNDTATTEIYTLSLHDALPICRRAGARRRDGGRGPRDRGERARRAPAGPGGPAARARHPQGARPAAAGRARVVRSEETRLNSSHANISYAVFCLKKKN